MEPEAKAAYQHMISDVLEDVDGRLKIEEAKDLLFDMVEREKFNTERAEEIFQIAIEKLFWAKFGSTGAVGTRDITGSGVTEKFAAQFVKDFKNGVGVTDQRPARRGLSAKIFGK